MADSPALPQADPTDIGRIIFLEAEAVRRFVGLLRAENQALSDDDTDRLPTLAAEKEELAVHLKQLTEQRDAELRLLGHTADSKGVIKWCAEHPAEVGVGDAWAAILADAREAKELNALNGELIKARIDHSAKALEILRHGDDPLELYGPDGQSKKHGLKRINDAA
ncbi:MAG: flagellar protein FlgN [Candidatus Accumulibacter sp.]|jgi:flagella synthesis protein FlgN|nr:flagellar protein FlgN [Accumulibacter sp.]